MENDIKMSNIDFFFKAILSLKTRDECYKFFGDLLTEQELKSLSQRLSVAYKLSKKEVYSKIVSETGASSATVSRVNHALQEGSQGYKLIFNRLGKYGER